MTYIIQQNIPNAQRYAIPISKNLEKYLDYLSTSTGWLVFNYEALQDANNTGRSLITTKEELMRILKPYYKGQDNINAYKL
jgi:hypothetical protein